MKTKTICIALTISIGLFMGCTDKKKEGEKLENVVTPVENKTPVVDNVDEAEKIKQDSIRQVKEHGHAH